MSRARGGSSIRSRLLRGLGVLVVILVISAAVSFLALRRLGGSVGLILRENYASVIACQEMNEALERQDSAALFAATGHDDLARPTLLEQRRAFDASFAREAANITIPGEGDTVAQIRGLYADYLLRVDAVLAIPGPPRLDAYFSDLLPRFRALKERIGAVLRLNQTNMEAADRNARDISRVTQSLVAAVSAVAILVAAWLFLWLTRTISRPLEQLAERTRAIGEGDFAGKVEGNDAVELAQLADAFNRMLEKLRAYRESSLGELLAAQHLSQATVEGLVDPVVVFDREGGVLLANHSAKETFGLSPASADELRESSVEIPEALRRARDDVLATGQPVLPQSFAESMPWISESGATRHFLVRAVPLRSEDGAGPTAVVVAQDVTRFRRIDELKSDVVATVSHELKTPLTALRLATHMLLDPSIGPLSDAHRYIAETARDDTERLRATVDELLDLVRIEREAGALRRDRVPVSTILEEVLEVHQPIADGKDVKLAIAPSDPELVAFADPEKLKIVLANLVSNAIRHTPPEGRVELSAKADDDEVRFIVHDTGEGIGDEDLPRIFDRNFRGGAAKGDGRHGLGLAIAREIVEHHGGSIEVRSKEAEGSTFTVHLPLSK